MNTVTATPVSPVITDAPTIRLSDYARQCFLDSASKVAPRRIRVLLNLGDNKTIRGRTIYVGVNQLTIASPKPLVANQECSVFFGLSIEDQLYSIIGTGRVVSCVGTEGNGFRVELHFTAGDKRSQIALEQLFSTEKSNRVA